MVLALKYLLWGNFLHVFQGLELSIQVFINLHFVEFFSCMCGNFVRGIRNCQVATTLDQDFAHLEVALLGCIEKGSLTGYFILFVQIHFFFNELVDDIDSIFLSRIVERCLAIQIGIVKVQAPLEQEIQAPLLAIPTDIEKNSLLKIIFEVGVGSVLDEQLHDFIGLLVVNETGGEVEGRLAGLSFEPVDNDRIVFVEVLLDFFHVAV